MDPHDLYGLPLEQFTERRNVLAKELRREGRRDEAAAVSKLRKPSVAAWAVNQLIRTQRRDIETLFSAGDALQQAQADLLAKRGDAAVLRRAVETERDAIRTLAEKARGLLDSDGHELTTTRLEQVTETLHAAALDGEARARVSDGCLDRELRHVGLGAFDATSPGPRTPRKRDAGRESASRQRHGAELKAARQAEAAARRKLERAEREQQAAERRRERAEVELRDAEQALLAARELAAEAESELGEARRRLDDL
jgi:hypothetical protein